MEKLEKLSEGYGWIEKITSKSIIEFLKTKDMLEEVHNRFFEKYELSNTKFNILVILHKEVKINGGELYMSMLGERMLLSNANITGLVDRLEKQNFVKRVRSSNDRRKIVIKITEEGTECIEKVIDKYTIWLEKLMSTLELSEKQKMVELLQKIQLNIINMNEMESTK